MELIEAIESRHSVRKYLDKPIEDEKAAKFARAIALLNERSGLHMQLVLEEPAAFGNFLAKYGKFENVRNYIALVGPKGRDLEVDLGYYGEKAVLYAQQLGLNTCWVGGTYSKGKTVADVRSGEKLVGVIALGYGENAGTMHRGKSMIDVCEVSEVSREVPQWYKRGVMAALLAPTAVNQQKFAFSRDGNRVTLKRTSRGPFTALDLGIVKCHFEIGAGIENFEWA